MADDEEAPTGAVELGPLSKALGYALRRAQVAVFQDFHRAMAALDLRPAQYSVLHVIGLNPGLRPSQAAEALGIQRTNFVPLLDELERHGLVERARDPDDKRAVALRLTGDGEALLRRATRRVRAHEKRMTERLEPGGADHLLRLLDQLAAGE